MTFNWGHKLLLAFLAFGGLIIYLVYSCMQTNFDLVSKEYYKDELAYQQVIDGTANANALSSTVTVRANDEFVTIGFPGEMKSGEITGTAWFYCATDARRDKKIPLETGTGAVQQIPVKQLLPGVYTVKISWDHNNHHYYTEQEIRL